MVSPWGLGIRGTELGSTDVPSDLVPGDTSEITDSYEGMRTLGNAARQVADGLTTMTTDGWQGDAADRFRGHFTGTPGKWQALGDALVASANALDQHCQAIDSGQRTAKRAIGLWAEGERLTGEWKGQVDAYNDRVDAYNNGDGPHPGDRPGPNPGEAKRAEAQRILADARAAVTASGDTHAATINRCVEQLPDTPGLLDRIGMSLADTASTFASQAVDVHAGAWNGVKQMAEFSARINPLTPGNLGHPQEYMAAMMQLATGMAKAGVAAYNDPTGTAQKIAQQTWDKWSKGSIGYNLGELLPDVALGLATGGSATAATRATRLAEMLGLDADDAGQAASRAARHADDLTPHVPDTPNRQASPWDHWNNPTTDTTPGGWFDNLGDIVTDRSFGPIGSAAEQIGDTVGDWIDNLGKDTPSSHGQPPPRHEDIDDGWAGIDQPRTEPSTTQQPAPPTQHHAEPQQPVQHVPQHAEPPVTQQHAPDPATHDVRHDQQAPDPDTRPGGEHAQGDHDPVDARDPDRPAHPLADDLDVRADVEHSAANPEIDLNSMPDDLVWRTSDEPLWRIESGRDIDDIFENGCTPWSDNLDNFDNYVHNNEASGWVGTTANADLWMTHMTPFPDKIFVLEIEARGGVDVEASRPDDWKIQIKDEQEIAMPGGVTPERIKGGFWVTFDPTTGARIREPGSWVSNPNYIPDERRSG